MTPNVKENFLTFHSIHSVHLLFGQCTTQWTHTYTHTYTHRVPILFELKVLFLFLFLLLQSQAKSPRWTSWMANNGPCSWTTSCQKRRGIFLLFFLSFFLFHLFWAHRHSLHPLSAIAITQFKVFIVKEKIYKSQVDLSHFLPEFQKNTAMWVDAMIITEFLSHSLSLTQS